MEAWMGRKTPPWQTSERGIHGPMAMLIQLERELGDLLLKFHVNSLRQQRWEERRHIHFPPHLPATAETCNQCGEGSQTHTFFFFACAQQ